MLHPKLTFYSLWKKSNSSCTSDYENTPMRQLGKSVPLLIGPESRISRNACPVGGQTNPRVKLTG